MAKDAEGAPLVWTRATAARRGRTPGLTHTQIAHAAVAIADAEGLEAVSMRRVAADLGVGTMSLYRYVATRDEVLDLMVDEVVGDFSLDGAAPGDWRRVLVLMARSSRTMIHRHPWMARHALGTRPAFGPNMLRWVESSTALLDRDGLTMDQILDLNGTVTSFVIGYTQVELAEQDEQRRTGMTEAQWRARMGPYLTDVVAGGDFPYLERIFIEAEDFPDPDVVFERRLAYVLDGLGVGLGLT